MLCSGQSKLRSDCEQSIRVVIYVAYQMTLIFIGYRRVALFILKDIFTFAKKCKKFNVSNGRGFDD